MFKLIQSIFDSTPSAAERYPDSLIEKATERAVDGVDTRLRVVSGYKKRLRSSIIHAIDHVVKLVDDLATPIDASRKHYGRDPYLTAFFASANESQQFFSNDHGIWNYLDKFPEPKPERIFGLLMMNRTEKQLFGMEMEGEQLRRDVPQIAVSFSAHQLRDPNAAEDETRRLLKHRAFDHLIELALRDVINHRLQRLELEKQMTLLRRKLAAFEKADLGFDTPAHGESKNQAAIQEELDKVETQLKAMPAKTELLNISIDALVDVFSNASQKLWTVPVSMIMDRMHIKRECVSSNASELKLTEFHSANGVIKTGVLVSYQTDELSARKELFSEIGRYL